ncbi:hypothetical protein YC2023_022117 [Brassica napus]
MCPCSCLFTPSPSLKVVSFTRCTESSWKSSCSLRSMELYGDLEVWKGVCRGCVFSLSLVVQGYLLIYRFRSGLPLALLISELPGLLLLSVCLRWLPFVKQYTEAEVRKLQDEGALELRILSIAGFPGFCLVQMRSLLFTKKSSTLRVLVLSSLHDIRLEYVDLFIFLCWYVVRVFWALGPLVPVGV